MPQNPCSSSSCPGSIMRHAGAAPRWRFTQPRGDRPMSDGMLIARATATGQAPPYAVAITAGHHALTADEPKSIGGGDSGPSPFALVASGLGACTAITLRMYAERKQWPLRGLTVALTVVKAADDALQIERSVTLEGDLSAEQRARLAEIAEKTPVTKALRTG